jgi:molybdopterin converting factor small subunit
MVIEKLGRNKASVLKIIQYICDTRKQRYKIAFNQMPTYKILLFGITRDLLQKKEMDFSCEKKLNASDLLKALKNEFTEFDQLPSLRLAVEQHFPENNFMVEENMEIALIPPVSGG